MPSPVVSPYGRTMPSPEDVYVSSSQVRRFGLRIGDRISGAVRSAGEFPLSPGLTAQQLVLLADGVTGDAARSIVKAAKTAVSTATV